MEKYTIIQKIENGKQTGIWGIINKEGREFSYTYAVQKINNNYILFTENYFLDEADYDFPERYEHFEVFETLSDVFEKLEKYNILPENMSTSKGIKFFNDKQINLMRYIGENNSLTNGNIYNILFTENECFCTVNDNHEKYLCSCKLFEKI